MKETTQSQICLYCNLQHIFTQYRFSEDSVKVLTPNQVRRSLGSLFKDNGDYEEGNQGCAQETFQEVMAYLHRESKRPDYLEQCLKFNSDANSEARFRYDNMLDDDPCQPTCIAHTTFGLQLCEIVTCTACASSENFTSISYAYTHLLYVSELFEAQGKSQYPLDFEKVLKTIFDTELRQKLG